MKISPSLLALIACPFLVVSCAQDSMTGDTYSRAEAGHAQAVKTGRITSVRNVKLEGGTTAGTIIGAVAGGVLGHEIGGGSTAHTIGAVGGALAGSAIGSHVQQSVGSRNGIEITVHLDQGGSISVVQEFNPRESFHRGDRVRVLYNGFKTRVTH